MHQMSMGVGGMITHLVLPPRRHFYPTHGRQSCRAREHHGLLDDRRMSCYQHSLYSEWLEEMGPWSRKKHQGICDVLQLPRIGFFLSPPSPRP